MREGKWQRPDGVELYHYSLLPAKPKGTVVILHGLGEYSGRYRDFASYLASHDWAVHLYDLRGHGKSGGPPMYARSVEQLAEDLKDFLHRVAPKKGEDPFFLIAHSFGGQVAINYLAKNRRILDGVVLSAPNVKVAVAITPLKRLAAKLVSAVLPTLQVANDIPAEAISRDPAVVEAYEHDPLVHRKISVQLGTQLLDNIERVPKMAAKIRLPILILHGSEDRITSPRGSREFYERVNTRERKLKIYPGFYHEILNELGKEEVYRDIEQWLTKRAKHAGRKNSAA
jgi:alpha-beta hydrolase superfamily lysophospholipase